MDNINHFLNLEIMKLAKQIEIYTEVLRVHHQNLKEIDYYEYTSYRIRNFKTIRINE